MGEWHIILEWHIMGEGFGKITWDGGVGRGGAHTMESTERAMGLLAAVLGRVFLLARDWSFSISTSQGSLHT